MLDRLVLAVVLGVSVLSTSAEAKTPSDITKLGFHELLRHQERSPKTYRETQQRGEVVFSLAMPKSGTESLHYFFLCRDYLHSSHYVCGFHQNSSARTLHCGHCIDDAIRLNTSFETTCGYHSAYNQMDAELTDGFCSFPQMTHLDFIEEKYPDAKFILQSRDAEAWLHSVHKWINHMELRLLRCFLLLGQYPLPTGMNEVPTIDLRDPHTWLELYYKHDGDRILLQVYKEYINRIEERFKNRPDKLLHVNLEDCAIESKLTTFLKLSPADEGKSCFAHKKQTNASKPCINF